MDILLSLCPWFIVRELLLSTREKVGLVVAMSLGALTGIVVILRAFILWLLRNEDQYRTSKSNLYLQKSVRRANSQLVAFAFLIISVILEPSITIIAQAIPMFRVMFAKAKEARTMDAYRVADALGNTSNAHSRQRTWNKKAVTCSETHARKEPDEELLHVRVEQTVQLSTISASAASGASEDGDDIVYAGRRQATKIW